MAHPSSPTLAAIAAIPPTLVLMTTEQTAELLNCSPITLAVDRVRRRWKVPFCRVGRCIRYDRAAVLRWLADRNPDMVEG